MFGRDRRQPSRFPESRVRCARSLAYCLLVVLAVSVTPVHAGTPGQTLAEIRAVTPPVDAWETWLAETGELPPDFDTMPSIPDLQSPDEPIDNPRGTVSWDGSEPARRAAIREAFDQWILGAAPPAPGNVTARRLSAAMEYNGISTRIELRFGPAQAARLEIETFVPDGPGPFPVYLTQTNHRAWARIAMERGYFAVVYHAADLDDDAAVFGEVWPDHDWALLRKRAWAASRVIDYLESEPRADMDAIAIAGHSRNGKQALIAGAFDERIDAVIASSAGAGGVMPWRLSTEYEYAESIERMTRQFPHWFHPRLRFFVGREDKLPVDQHHLLSLLRDRHLRVSTAINDGVEQTRAIQVAVFAAGFGETSPNPDRPGNATIAWRTGSHETTGEDVQRDLDWLDVVLRGGPPAAPGVTSPKIHPGLEIAADGSAIPLPAPSPDLLQLDNGRTVDHKDVWLLKRWEVRQAIRAALGQQPPTARANNLDYGTDPPHIDRLLERHNPGDGLRRIDAMIGAYINADIYVPKGQEDETSGKRPAILFLGPANRSKGYVAGYRIGDQPFQTLARAGYIVLTYDPIGYGRRVEEDTRFYARHPQWSLLGKMVEDAQAAIDRLAIAPQVDRDQIYVVGYGMGAWTALHLAALDDRVAGVAAVAPPGPYAFEEGQQGRNWWDWSLSITRALPPQRAHQPDAPGYDLRDLIAASAPKPQMLLQPSLNWRVDHVMQAEAVREARRVYQLHGAGNELVWREFRGTVAFDPPLQAEVVTWLRMARGLPVESQTEGQ